VFPAKPNISISPMSEASADERAEVAIADVVARPVAVSAAAPEMSLRRLITVAPPQPGNKDRTRPRPCGMAVPQGITLIWAALLEFSPSPSIRRRWSRSGETNTSGRMWSILRRHFAEIFRGHVADLTHRVLFERLVRSASLRSISSFILPSDCEVVDRRLSIFSLFHFPPNYCGRYSARPLSRIGGGNCGSPVAGCPRVIAHRLSIPIPSPKYVSGKLYA
jgi:hypothetical protein